MLLSMCSRMKSSAAVHQRENTVASGHVTYYRSAALCTRLAIVNTQPSKHSALVCQLIQEDTAVFPQTLVVRQDAPLATSNKICFTSASGQ